MLFFRTNATTIEVIEEKDKKESADELWGLAWKWIRRGCTKDWLVIMLR